MKLSYYYYKLKEKIFRNPDYINQFYRNKGAKIGENVLLCNNTYMPDPAFVEIGNDVVISSNVSFITHDHSIKKVCNKSNLFGKIVIGNNCFIGYGSILLYGVELSQNIIVASGSVVTKSFKTPNVIIAGNPAKIIGTWDDFYKKYSNHAVCLVQVASLLLQNSNKLIKKYL